MSTEIYANLLPRAGARDQPQPYMTPQPSLRRAVATSHRRGNHNTTEEKEEAEYDNIYVQVTSSRQRQETQENTERNTVERGAFMITDSPEISANRKRSWRGCIIALFVILLVISLTAVALAVAALAVTLVRTHVSEDTESQEMDHNNSSINITRKSLWGLSEGGIGGPNILATVRGVQFYQNCTTDTYNIRTTPTTQSSTLASVLSTRWTTTNKTVSEK